MHKSIVLIFALAAVGFSPNAASARTFAIKYVSQSALQSACGKVSGDFASGGGRHYCASECGKPGQHCQIDCDATKKTCTGTVPHTRLVNFDSPLHILTGGQAVQTETTGSGTPPRTGILDAGILNGGSGPGGNGPSAAGSPSTPSAPASAPQIR